MSGRVEDGMLLAYKRLRTAYDVSLAANQRLEAENQQLREFVVAHTLVEKGVTDFDLQNDAVLRLRKASEQPAVLATIREALAGGTE